MRKAGISSLVHWEKRHSPAIDISPPTPSYHAPVPIVLVLRKLAVDDMV